MTSYTFRLDENLKQDAFSVFKQYGVNPAQAIKMFLRQVAETKTIPVQLNYQPNAETAQAIQEINEGKGIQVALKPDESLHSALLRVAMEVEDEKLQL